MLENIQFRKVLANIIIIVHWNEIYLHVHCLDDQLDINLNFPLVEFDAITTIVRLLTMIP